MNNLSSYCGLADSRISASDKNLPVRKINEDFLNLVKTQLQEYKNAPLKNISNHCVVLSFVDTY